jgi:predicted aldo/keto reductase-like oxidoreductase
MYECRFTLQEDNKMPQRKPSGFSRRTFLKTASAAGIGSLLTPLESKVARASQEGTSKNQRQVPTRTFGKTGVQVSSLSLGGMFDTANNHILLKQAINWGITYWDTADCYGGSEKGIGKYFKKFPEDRSNIFLVSKSCERDVRGMERLLNRSLERMNTDYIDLYFVHGIKSISEIGPATRKWAEKAKADGIIRYFGFSTHSNMEECLSSAAKLNWIDGIMMTYNYRLMHKARMIEAVDACVQAGIGLTAMKTQGGGSIKTDSPEELKMAGRFLEKGFTDKQAKLKAVWENPQIASICSQMPNMTILMANTAAALDKTKLSATDMQLLDKYAQDTDSTYCAGCTHVCESAVDSAIPIGDIMRHLMYANSYGDYSDHLRAKGFFDQLSPKLRRQLASLDFSQAERRCPQKMAIGRLMREALDMFA